MKEKLSSLSDLTYKKRYKSGVLLGVLIFGLTILIPFAYHSQGQLVDGKPQADYVKIGTPLNSLIYLQTCVRADPMVENSCFGSWGFKWLNTVANLVFWITLSTVAISQITRFDK